MVLQREACCSRCGLDPCDRNARREDVAQPVANLCLEKRIIEVQQMDDMIEPVVADAFGAHQAAGARLAFKNDRCIAERRTDREAGEAAAQHHDIGLLDVLRLGVTHVGPSRS